MNTPQRHRIKEHDVLVKSLAELGKQLGFDVHADIDGYRRTSFPFDIENKDRVKEIDVIWFSDKNPTSIFEVENTPGVTEAIVRGGNIRSQEVLCVIVMPEERKRFLKRKAREPILRDQIVKYNWHMLTYDELNRFLNDKKGKPTLEGLMVRIVSLTNFKVDAQAPLHVFLKP